MSKKIIADQALTHLIFQLSWQERWKMGSRWADKWPFSMLKRENKKEWMKLVEADRKEREAVLSPTTRPKGPKHK